MILILLEKKMSDSKKDFLRKISTMKYKSLVDRNGRYISLRDDDPVIKLVNSENSEKSQSESSIDSDRNFNPLIDLVEITNREMKEFYAESTLQNLLNAEVYKRRFNTTLPIQLQFELDKATAEILQLLTENYKKILEKNDPLLLESIESHEKAKEILKDYDF